MDAVSAPKEVILTDLGDTVNSSFSTVPAATAEHACAWRFGDINLEIPTVFSRSVWGRFNVDISDEWSHLEQLLPGFAQGVYIKKFSGFKVGFIQFSLDDIFLGRSLSHQS